MRVVLHSSVCLVSPPVMEGTSDTEAQRSLGSDRQLMDGSYLWPSGHKKLDFG